MLTNEEIRQQAYRFFLEEAPDLLERIEVEMSRLEGGLTSLEQRNACVHELMRATHTLKGSAAGVGLETIQKIAHFLEDALRSLYNPEVEIDAELQSLLWEGFACLRLPLTSAITGSQIDETRAMEKATELFVQLEQKLGDDFGTGELPTAQEMGFDYIKSIFEVGVHQRLEEIEKLLSPDTSNLASVLTQRFQVLADLATSLNLTGFSEIATRAIQIIEKLPEQALEVGKIALKDLENGQILVLNGDRSQGGTPSWELLNLVNVLGEVGLGFVPSQDESQNELEISVTAWEESPLEPLTPVNEEPASSSQNDIDLSESFQSLHEILDNFDFELVQEQDQRESDVEIEVSFTQDEASRKELSVESLSEKQDVQPSKSTIKGDLRQPVFDNTHSTATTTAAIPPATSNVRVSTEVLARLSYNIGELLVAQNRQATNDLQLQEMYRKSLEAQQKLTRALIQLREWGDKFLSESRKSQTTQSLQKRRTLTGNLTTVLPSSWQKVLDEMELDRHSDLHVYIQAALEQAATLELSLESIEQFSEQSNYSMEKQQRMLGNIRDDLIEARMLPLAEVFQRFPHMVKQLCTTYGKSLELQILGGDVLVDKAIAEKLYDPLLHLIRNAFDHGIEISAVREQYGKSPTGQIIINAYQRGGYTIIEIKDDGAGIDLDRIRQKAISNKIYDSDTANNLNQSQLLDLIFQSGFSTNDTVTNLSGRGVGLDVVRMQLQALKGDVSVYSKRQQGTVFVLQIPLTMTIGRLMLVNSNSTTYGILSEEIEQILLAKPEQIRNFQEQRILYLSSEGEDRLVPIRKLSDLLVYSSLVLLREPTEQRTLPDHLSKKEETFLLLLKDQNRYLALEVDRIIGEQETLIRPLGRLVPVPNYIYGCSELGDSCSYLALDGSGLISYAYGQIFQTNQVINTPLTVGSKERKLLPPAIDSLAATRKKESHSTILIVDDSISQRRTLTLFLEQKGYKVLQAIDGLDALQQLEAGVKVDIILCDIEMPRLNGFEFLNRCRQNSNVNQLPVIMLTSRTHEKHRQIAMELGANGYLTKPFKEAELLSILKESLRK